MDPDQARIDDTRAWVVRAREDAATARDLLELPSPRLRPALFFCQQSVEKVLKALLAWHDVSFPKTHNLAVLSAQCLRLVPALGAVLPKAHDLTVYAWRFRYPGSPQEPDLDEARSALAVTQDVLEAVLEHLPESVRP